MGPVVKPARAASRRPPGGQRLRLWVRLLLARRAVEAELRERLRVAFGMTLPQFDVMAALARRPGGMTMTELSRMLMVSNGNVTGIVDRLIIRQDVAREILAEDRRRSMVSLTHQGAERFNAAAKLHETWVDELMSSFDPNTTALALDRFGRVSRRGQSERSFES